MHVLHGVPIPRPWKCTGELTTVSHHGGQGTSGLESVATGHAPEGFLNWRTWGPPARTQAAGVPGGTPIPGSAPLVMSPQWGLTSGMMAHQDLRKAAPGGPRGPQRECDRQCPDGHTGPGHRPLEQKGSSTLQGPWGHLATRRPPQTRQPSAGAGRAVWGRGRGSGRGGGHLQGSGPGWMTLPQTSPVPGSPLTSSLGCEGLSRGGSGDSQSRSAGGGCRGGGAVRASRGAGPGGRGQDTGHWQVSGCTARSVSLNTLLIYVQGAVFKG